MAFGVLILLNLLPIACGYVLTLDPSATVPPAGSLGVQFSATNLPRISYYFNAKQLNLWTCHASNCLEGSSVPVNTRNGIGGFSSLVWFPDDTFGILYSLTSLYLNYSYCLLGSCFDISTYQGYGNFPMASAMDPTAGPHNVAVVYADANYVQLALCGKTQCSSPPFLPLGPRYSPSQFLVVAASRQTLPPAILWLDVNLTLILCANSSCGVQTRYAITAPVDPVTAIAITAFNDKITFGYTTDNMIVVYTCLDVSCSNVFNNVSYLPSEIFFAGNVTALSLAVGDRGRLLASFLVASELYLLVCDDIACSSSAFPILLAPFPALIPALGSSFGVPVIAFYTGGGLRLWWGTLLYNQSALTLPSLSPGNSYFALLPDFSSIYGYPVNISLTGTSVPGWAPDLDVLSLTLSGCVPPGVSPMGSVTLLVTDGVSNETVILQLRGNPVAPTPCSASTSSTTIATTGTTSTSNCLPGLGGLDCTCFLPDPPAATCHAGIWVINGNWLVTTTSLVLNGPVSVEGNFGESAASLLDLRVSVSFKGRSIGQLRSSRSPALQLSLPSASVNATGCVYLSGQLLLNFTSRPRNGESVVLFHSQSHCLSGGFSSVKSLRAYPKASCDNLQIRTSLNSSSFTVYVSLSSSGVCSSTSDRTAIIIGACIGGVALAALGIAAVLVWKFRLHRRLSCFGHRDGANL